MDPDSSLSSLSSIPDSEPQSPASPLSDLARTPSLPNSPELLYASAAQDLARRYPSPMSTASGTESPAKSGRVRLDDQSSNTDQDGPSPAKKRRIAPPKERTTEYLDMMKGFEELSQNEKHQMDCLAAALRKKKKIVVIAGAGISVSAGIPDFRSATGLFASNKNQHKLKASGKHLFDASVYKHNASTQSFHTMVREMSEMTNKAQPTPFHHLLASLAREGRLMRLYSQNIDCIDTKMEPLATHVPLDPKGPWPATIQLHGGLEKMVCTKCSQLEPFDGSIFDGPEAPLCQACEAIDKVRTTFAGKRSHGIGRLRPRFVLYNEYNPDEEAIGNVSSADLKARPDAVLVVGTSLKIPGTRRLVKELCQVTRSRKGGFTAWINIDSEPKGVEFKDCWDLVVRAKCDDVAALAALPPLGNCTIGTDYLVPQDAKAELPNSRFEVHLGAKPKQIEDTQTIPTPRPSPKLSSTTKASKLKQTTLPFGQDAAKDTKASKASKPRGRKQKAVVSKEQPTKKDLLNTFKAVKSTADRAISTKKTASAKGEAPLLEQLNVSSTYLPALRPEKRKSIDTFVYKVESDNLNMLHLTSTSVVTKSPPTETVSPKSIPKDMRQLID